MADVGNAIDDMGSPTIGSPIVVAPLQRMESVAEEPHGEEWIAIGREAAPSPDQEGRNSGELSSHSSHSPSPNPSSAPSPPPKSFRNSLTNNFKRLSTLPRSPSTKSRSSSRFSTPPSVSPALPPAPRQKIVSPWPSAMSCSELAGKRSAQERCVIYAQKINELYMYDCGLSDWIVEARFRGTLYCTLILNMN